MPRNDGRLLYSSSASVDALEDALGEALSLDHRVVVIHGVERSFPFPRTVSGVEGVAPHRNIPVTCGRLARMEP